MARAFVSQVLLLVAMVILNSSAKDTDVAEYLSDVETHEEHAQSRGHRELPTTCERGMGDDIRKTYPPYVIMSHDGPKRRILCDTHTDGGGWIVFQRRVKGNVDFYRDWTAYRDGFGFLTGDFWMGNEALYNLTNKHPYELRIDIRIKDGQEVFARYPNFRIEDESNKYRLQIGSYSGTAGDYFSYQKNMFFTTFDRDNDKHGTVNCAIHHPGGWWYNACLSAALNVEWDVTGTKTYGWRHGTSYIPVSFSEMKMRRIQVI
ncbi:ficolin-2 [Plakobranchus ocellatus]|uniref:Ficolin-2 n=1 Tax=Plakobranchus ocellatus TaxID=259542 RepID=A0AAV4D380_9GAST|nr:ficolin-2 [Plakobranchus ocellatus]